MSTPNKSVEKGINLKIDTSELSPQHIRLLKQINSTLLHLLIADDEQEYFELSRELIKTSAQLIKSANIAKNSKNMHQAIEYAIDHVYDDLAKNVTAKPDN